MNNVQDPVAGLYTVVASNSLGTASASATLAVVHPPAFTMQPQNQTVTRHGTAMFSAQVSGTSPIIFKWLLNGSALPGATSSSLTLNNAGPWQAGDYRLVASNVAGAATSAVARLSFAASLVTTGAVWRYLDNGSDAGTAWRETDFDDSTWNSGPAQLGYGDGDEATVVNSGPSPTNRFTTTYFRRTFDIPAPGVFSNLALRLLRDDGAVVYLNGTEILRNNLPAGSVSSATFALGVVGGGDEAVYLAANINPGFLRNGPNVLAVEIHQANLESTDISFDCELTGTHAAFAPEFLRQPQSQVAVIGNSAGFSADVFGSQPVFFQWLKDGLPIAGLNPTLTWNNVQPSDAGTYTLRAANAYGTTYSAPVSLVLLARPSILTQPQSREAFTGERVSFTVSADGTPPLHYQWLRNGVPMFGNIFPTLTFASASIGTIASYSVIVSNAAGVVQSSAAYLNVSSSSGGVPPQILVQPVSRKIYAGDGAAFSVIADGAVAWQWRKNGLPLTGESRTNLTLTNVQPAYAGSYSLALSNAYGVTISDAAILTVANRKPKFILHPQRESVLEGGSIELHSAAKGNEPLRYQWLRSGRAIVGETNASLTITNMPATGAGVYAVVASNPVGRTRSAGARISVVKRVRIVTQPRPKILKAGATASFSVRVSGSAPISYQWMREGTPLPGATKRILSLRNVSLSDAGSYWVVVSNPVGNVSSEVVTLAVSAPATIASAKSAVAGVPSLSAARLEDGRIKIAVNGESGGTVELQASPDLVNWQRIASRTNFTGSFEFTEPPASGSAGKFFRAVRRE